MSQQPPHQRERPDDRRQSRPTQVASQPQRREHHQRRQPPQYGSQQPPQQQQQPPQYVSQQSPQHQQPSQRQQQQQQRQQSQVGGVQRVEQGDQYVHVRFRNPDDFAMIRTPDWAAHAAQDIAPGAEVRTGKLRGSGEWQTESVLIPTPVDGQTAARLARRIVEKIGE